MPETVKPRSASSATIDLDNDEAFGAATEALMLELATDERFERLGAIAHEHILTGGRRKRVSLARQAGTALGVPSDVQLGWAAACDLLHNACLIHDDIQDRSQYRRGSYSVWVRHGTAQAINAGDLLLMLPYLALGEIPVDPAKRWELSRAIAKRAADTVRGQSLELCLIATHRWSWRDYELAVRDKTSAILALPIHGAALLAGWDNEKAHRVAERFTMVGFLLQIRDDILDLYGDPVAGGRGVHLREGKISAPIVEQLTRSPDDLRWLGPLLSKDVEETTDQDVDRAAAHFESSGALRAVFDRVAALNGELERDPVLAESPPLAAIAGEIRSQAVASLEGIRASLK